jgi:hypothetical protein
MIPHRLGDWQLASAKAVLGLGWAVWSVEAEKRLPPAAFKKREVKTDAVFRS